MTLKKIYKTPEERRQTNRKAQASFRQRQQACIKDLEASREECLLLRYQESLLERILLEKGKERK